MTPAHESTGALKPLPNQAQTHEKTTRLGTTDLEAGKATTSCLACQDENVTLFLDLGETALANKFLAADEVARGEPKYPLRVGFCNGCGHVQLMDVVPPGAMFEDYLYVSGASSTLRSHLWSLSDQVVAWKGLAPEDLVIDVGCNDGTLLHGFRRHGVRTLGVDPAQNLATIYRGDGVDRYVGFFGAATAQAIRARKGPATVVTATNTFPHIPDLAGFVQALDVVLRPGGVFVLEAHYLVDILDALAFDTIYHEHVSYWALGPMKRLFERHGFEIVDAERLPIHHGQIRVFVQRKGEGEIRPTVPALIEAEHERGIDQLATYQEFAKRVGTLKRRTLELIRDIRHRGETIAGYGAPAKANTLLEFFGIGPEHLPYICDISSLKQGRFTPGMHIPIVSPDRLIEDRPDHLLILAWNFAPEIMRQQAEYAKAGGRFLVPVPEVRHVEPEA